MRTAMKRAYAMVGGAILIGGCAVGPDYVPPKPQMPTNFIAGHNLGELRATEQQTPVTLTEWWKRFDDQLLHQLVTRAIEKNHDVAISLLRVADAREAARQALSDLLPGSQVRSGYDSTKSTGARAPFKNASGNHYEVYDAGMDFLWEIDIFGRLRRAREERNAELESSVATLDDAVRMLVSEVVTTYLQLRSADEQLAMVQKSVDTQTSSLELVRTQQRAGSASDLDVARSEALLAQERALLPPIEKARQQAAFRIAVLCGTLPEEIDRDIAGAKPLPAFRGSVPVDSPTELLRRRPDLRAAERQLAAATAGIGVAEGQLYPIITFEGSLGVEAISPQRWFEGGAGVYSLMPKLKWKPFDNGTLHSQLRVAGNKEQEALHAYEQAVLKALEETEGALVSFGAAQRARDELQNAAAASGRALELAKVEYSVGSKDYLTVLDAQRTHLDAELGRVKAQADLELALVDVFRAFGGGWEVGPQVDATQDVRSEISSAVATTAPSTTAARE